MSPKTDLPGFATSPTRQPHMPNDPPGQLAQTIEHGPESSNARSSVRTVVNVSCLLRSQSMARAVMPDLAKTELRAPLPAHNSTKIGVVACGSIST